MIEKSLQHVDPSAYSSPRQSCTQLFINKTENNRPCLNTMSPFVVRHRLKHENKPPLPLLLYADALIYYSTGKQSQQVLVFTIFIFIFPSTNVEKKMMCI
ncbi:hypothetical protein WJF24_23590 [Salmonella enterica subsp. enterica serovar Corvallis]